MAKKVTLYFETEQDALRFTLAAGSVMTQSEHDDAGKNALHLVRPLKNATRIRVGRTSSRDDEVPSTAKAG